MTVVPTLHSSNLSLTFCLYGKYYNVTQNNGYMTNTEARIETKRNIIAAQMCEKFYSELYVFNNNGNPIECEVTFHAKFNCKKNTVEYDSISFRDENKAIDLYATSKYSDTLEKLKYHMAKFGVTRDRVKSIINSFIDRINSIAYRKATESVKNEIRDEFVALVRKFESDNNVKLCGKSYADYEESTFEVYARDLSYNIDEIDLTDLFSEE